MCHFLSKIMFKLCQHCGSTFTFYIHALCANVKYTQINIKKANINVSSIFLLFIFFLSFSFLNKCMAMPTSVYSE